MIYRKLKDVFLYLIDGNYLIYYYIKMCINCLTDKLLELNSIIDETTLFYENVSCDCCVVFGNFIIKQLKRLKILCHTKVKINDEKPLFDTELNKLNTFADKITNDIKSDLNDYSNELFEKKENMLEADYLFKMNSLQNINNDIEDINNLCE